MIGKSMKKKINSQFVRIAVLCIIGILLLFTLLFYQLFQKEVMDDLRVCALQLKSLGVGEEYQNIKKTSTEGLRITIVKPDGTVKFDNFMDASELSNHSERPEIKEALRKGEGQDIRTSETLNKSTFYYAVLLKDGNVLRISKEAGNVWNIVFYAMPFIMGMSVAILILTVVISHYLTKSIVKPIEQAAQDLEHLERIQTYEEIEPFIEMIQAQHRNIVQNVQVRQEFTANVSHELKTPLTAISGYAELIENGMATEADTVRFAKEIHRNSNRLLTLINDIIRLSQLDVVENELEKESVDLSQVGQCMVDMLQFSAEKNNITVHYQGEPVVLEVNRTMMEELIYNLTDNAIRYNKPNGEVFVTIKKEEKGASITVKDTGIGITKENQERIFERFFRVDKSHSRETGGTGLGLAIVKHIIVQHKAKLEMDSEPGVGTTITVYLQS